MTHTIINSGRLRNFIDQSWNIELGAERYNHLLEELFSAIMFYNHRCFKESRTGIYSLCEKLNIRADGMVHHLLLIIADSLMMNRYGVSQRRLINGAMYIEADWDDTTIAAIPDIDGEYRIILSTPRAILDTYPVIS